MKWCQTQLGGTWWPENTKKNFFFRRDLSLIYAHLADVRVSVSYGYAFARTLRGDMEDSYKDGCSGGVEMRMNNEDHIMATRKNSTNTQHSLANVMACRLFDS